jgi:putative ABC transport system permease protein
MRSFYKLPLRIRSLFRKSTVEEELSEELRFHLEKLIEQSVTRGMTPEEARYAALRELGAVEQIKEECRDMRRMNHIENFIQDLRYGLRMLAKNPGFTAVAVLTLALGIGPNATIFTVLNAVLIRPLPYQDPQRLVLIKEKLPELTSDPLNVPASDIGDFQRQNKSFSAVAGFQPLHMELSGGGQPERIAVTRVSPSLFPLLRVAPMLGRTFADEEDHPGTLVTVLSYGVWKSHFAGGPEVLGKTVLLDRRPYTVIGIMPQGFEFPLDSEPLQPASLWVPLALTPEELSDYGDNYDYEVVARLKPGVTHAQADSDVDAIAHRILQAYPVPESIKSGIRLGAVTVPLREAVSGRVAKLLWILFGAVGLILLIACANVANLLLARTADRQKEIAVRAALGAGRWRLARQFMIESALLALVGGGIGLLLAAWGMGLLVVLSPADLPAIGGISVDGKVLGFTLGLSVLTAILFGAGPALAIAGTDLSQTLKENAAGTGQGVHHRAVRSVLVVAEAALALMLLVGAGLLVRSFNLLRKTDPGFKTEHLLTMSLDLPEAKYQRGEEVLSFYQRLLDRLQGLPGVGSVGAGTSMPMVNTNWDHVFTPEGYEGGVGGGRPDSWHALVLGNYFQTLQIPLIRGRYFTDQDRQGSLPVVIVSESIVKRYWTGQDPIGKRLHWGPPQSRDPWLTIVGVVGDVKQLKLGEPTSLHTYQPYLQLQDHWTSGLGRWLTVATRASGSPPDLASAVKASVWSLDRELAIAHLETVEQAVSHSLASPRFVTLLMAAFASVALVLGSVGLYAVVSFNVSRRTHELGLRMALGARPADVLRLVIGQGFKLTVLGVGIGVAGALGVTHFLSSLLYGVRPTDPGTFVAVSMILTGIALLASYIPARRATKVDPMVALRYE